MNTIKLPEYYYEGYVLMNKDEDIIEYTHFESIADNWRMHGEPGRKIAKIIMYDQEDIDEVE